MWSLQKKRRRLLEMFSWTASGSKRLGEPRQTWNQALDESLMDRQPVGDDHKTGKLTYWMWDSMMINMFLSQILTADIAYMYISRGDYKYSDNFRRPVVTCRKSRWTVYFLAAPK